MVDYGPVDQYYERWPRTKGKWSRDQWIAWWDDMPPEGHAEFSVDMSERIAAAKAKGYNVVPPPLTYRESRLKLADSLEDMGRRYVARAKAIRLLWDEDA